MPSAIKSAEEAASDTALAPPPSGVAPATVVRLPAGVDQLPPGSGRDGRCRNGEKRHTE